MKNNYTVTKNSFLKILVLIELVVILKALRPLIDNIVITDDFKFTLYILIPFFLAILFNFLAEVQVNGSYKNDPYRVNLRNSAAVKGKEDIVDVAIEVGIFSRTQNFKNDPRGNIMLIKSAYTVSMIIVLIVLSSYFIFSAIYPFMTINLNINYKDILAGYLTAIAAINGLYWLEKSKHKEKWNYLSAEYNKIITERDYSKPIQTMNNNISVLLNALAIDIIITMMWGHRSFKELFLNEAKKAVDHFIGNTTCSLMLLKDFHFSEAELIFILENYQRELMSYKSLTNFDATSKGNWLERAKQELNP